MGPGLALDQPRAPLSCFSVTHRTKQFLGSLVVVLLCLGGVGAYALMDRGSDYVGIAQRDLAAAAQPAAGTTGSPTATPSSAGAAAPAVKVAALARAAKAKAKGAVKAGTRTKTTTRKPKRSTTAPEPAATIAAAPTSSVKKGASIFGTPSGITGALADSGVSWTYNWAAEPNGVTAPKGVEYVPMIWGPTSADAATLAKAKQNGTTLLGFNEPDFADQANMSVKQALNLWPKLEATKMRLGSPAVAWGADQNGKWLDQFMDGAADRGYRVDFITLHWYGGDFNTTNATNQLRSYIQATYAKYHKPIWVTEYALMNFSGSPRLPSPAVQAEFVTKSTAMLEKLSYVERYAWFAFPTSTDGTDGTGLYRPGGNPTLLGQAYRAAGK